MAATIRAFIAIEIPRSVKDAIEAIQESMRRHGFKIRWVPPENIHLTLKFLGDVLPADTQKILRAMGRSAATTDPFELYARGVGVFPKLTRARILWVGIGGDFLTLGRLHGRLDEKLAVAGFPKETRPFRGHLTIGRMKGAVDARKLGHAMDRFKDFASVPFSADRMDLIKSELTSSGAVYTRLDQVQLENTTEDF